MAIFPPPTEASFIIRRKLFCKLTTVVQVSMIGALFSRLPLAYTFIHLADSDHLQKMRSSIALADFLLPSRV
ncbi:Non-reducing polyketide synthase ptaA [Trichinella pseudospiralis]